LRCATQLQKQLLQVAFRHSAGAHRTAIPMEEDGHTE